MFYQLKITRKGTKPPVWRRCTVAADVTFARMAAMLEKLVQYPAGSLYEIEFFQKKEQIRENGDGEAKNNFTLLNAGETETAELMDSEKWFTFRQYGADKETPEYRVDIEKKDEGTAEAPSIIKEVKGEDDPYWTEAPELGCTAAVETEVETAKASEDIAATVAAVEAAARAAKADEAATGSRRNPTVKDFLMSYRKEDLLSIAGELGLHCKGMDQEACFHNLRFKNLCGNLCGDLFLIHSLAVKSKLTCNAEKVFFTIRRYWLLRQLFRENASMLQRMSGIH